MTGYDPDGMHDKMATDGIAQFVKLGMLKIKDGKYQITEWGKKYQASCFFSWLRCRDAEQAPTAIELMHLNGCNIGDEAVKAYYTRFRNHYYYWKSLHKRIINSLTDEQKIAVGIKVKRTMKLPDWCPEMVKRALEINNG